MPEIYFTGRNTALSREKSFEERLAEALFTIHDGMTDALAQDFLRGEKDFTMKQHLVIRKVYDMMQTAPEGIPLKDLAAALRLTPGTVSELVEKLVQKNVLQRVQNPNDRRAVMITVTMESNRRLLEAKAMVSAYLKKLWEDFPEASKEDLNKRLELLAGRIKAQKNK